MYSFIKEQKNWWPKTNEVKELAHRIGETQKVISQWSYMILLTLIITVFYMINSSRLIFESKIFVITFYESADHKRILLHS